ncbi:MAG: TraI domain-containing protein [Ruminococcus flavefaciens]|nr:TraI domain-containing protein [Ruminococcus flavefaciens]
MTQEETMQVFRNYFSYIKRPGAADLLKWVESNGFFEAPASKRHHGARPGGLAEHSINVCRRLIQINAEEEGRQRELNYDLETLAICGLLHDLCKIDAYRKVEAAEGQEKPEYRLTRNFPAGHGEKSVILILQFMRLTQEEILAIRWHMGQYDFYARGGGYDLDNTFHQCKLAVMLHLADMMATHFDEREVAGNEKG